MVWVMSIKVHHKATLWTLLNPGETYYFVQWECILAEKELHNRSLNCIIQTEALDDAQHLTSMIKKQSKVCHVSGISDDLPE